MKQIISNRRKSRRERIVDGHHGFLLIDKNDNPKVAMHIEKIMQRVVEKYNEVNEEQLPRITPHVLRHTFCTRMAHSGMNPKTLQYIMGHSDVSITLNVYTHTSFDNAAKEMEKIMKIG